MTTINRPRLIQFLQALTGFRGSYAPQLTTEIIPVLQIDRVSSFAQSCMVGAHVAASVGQNSWVGISNEDTLSPLPPGKSSIVVVEYIVIVSTATDNSIALWLSQINPGGGALPAVPLDPQFDPSQAGIGTFPQVAARLQNNLPGSGHAFVSIVGNVPARFDLDARLTPQLQLNVATSGNNAPLDVFAKCRYYDAS